MDETKELEKDEEDVADDVNLSEKVNTIIKLKTIPSRNTYKY